MIYQVNDSKVRGSIHMVFCYHHFPSEYNSMIALVKRTMGKNQQNVFLFIATTRNRSSPMLVGFALRRKESNILRESTL